MLTSLPVRPGAVAAISLPGGCQQGQTDRHYPCAARRAGPFVTAPRAHPWAPFGGWTTVTEVTKVHTEAAAFPCSRTHSSGRFRGGSSGLNATSREGPGNWAEVGEARGEGARGGRLGQGPGEQGRRAEARAPLGPAGGQPGWGLAMSRASGRRPACRAEEQGSAQGRLLGCQVPAHTPRETLQHGSGGPGRPERRGEGGPTCGRPRHRPALQLLPLF